MILPKTTTALICVVCVSASAIAFAHNGATGIVIQRMEGMSAMGKALKSMSEMVKGTRSYDPAEMERHAALIKSHSGKAMLALFPVGSMQPASEANPEIWSNWARFTDLAMELEKVAQTLVETPDGIDGAAFKQIAGACAACHKDYRIKK